MKWLGDQTYGREAEVFECAQSPQLDKRDMFMYYGRETAFLDCAQLLQVGKCEEFRKTKLGPRGWVFECAQ